MKKQRIVLASGSPRRKELLGKIFKEFEVITSDADENIELCNPGEIVEELAKRKMLAVYDSLRANNSYKMEDDASLHNETQLIVIGADTIVYYDGEVLGKPQDEEEAKSMLSMLSDRTHQVYTGVAFLHRASDKDEPELASFHVKTDVTFYHLDRFDIDEYIKTGSPMDKAGAYGIQDDFAKHVRKIDGDYNNVVGLPVSRLYQELKEKRLV